MTWDKKYRMLKKGEIIQEGDEVDTCNDGWRDKPSWKLASCIGQPAPDPQYPSHRIYRRRIMKCPKNKVCPKQPAGSLELVGVPEEKICRRCETKGYVGVVTKKIGGRFNKGRREKKDLNGWKKCSEFPPPKNERVFITNCPDARDAYGQMSHIWISAVWFDEANKKWHGWAETKIHDVILWHPLPNPPEMLPKKRSVGEMYRPYKHIYQES